MDQFSLTTRLALNEFQASCYSHHRSQSALSETNWLLRVSGCNLNLNPYLVIQMRHHHEHPLTGAMELRPDHWSAALNASLRDPQGVIHWHIQNMITQPKQYSPCTYMLVVPTFKVNAFHVPGPTHFNSSYHSCS